MVGLLDYFLPAPQTTLRGAPLGITQADVNQFIDPWDVEQLKAEEAKERKKQREAFRRYWYREQARKKSIQRAEMYKRENERLGKLMRARVLDDSPYAKPATYSSDARTRVGGGSPGSFVAGGLARSLKGR